MKKVSLYYFIALVIPFAFFALLEGGLRFFDYGRTLSLFIENPNAPQYLLPRPDVVKRYFPEAAPAPSVTIETNFFLKNKAENGLRIVVQGGSTAAGFPFGYGASIAGMLDYRLKQTFPERPVEVINTALAAVNSYTMLDFVDEIIDQKPDAVLIYAGHNEYLGILGVGSAYTAANSQAATLLYLKVKELRIFQLLQNIYWQFSQTSEPENAQQSRTFMSKVAKHKNIPYGSSLYQQGIEQFDTNLSLLVAKYQAANIPVFISTIASNLADQRPFSSVKLSLEAQKQFSAISALNLTDTSAMQITELAALAKQFNSAEVYFHLAKVLQAQQQYLDAKQAFELAKDHDLLRFRAPSEINITIKKMAEKHQLYLVDSNQALALEATNGIIDNALMLEHLHPTITGYFEIANSFYQALAQSDLFGTFAQFISKAQASIDLPVFESERYWGKAKIAGLMADYPFTDSPQSPRLPKIQSWHDELGHAAYLNKATWLTIAQENFKRAQQTDSTTLVKSAKLLADSMPYHAKYNYQAGVTLIEQQKYRQAPRYLKRAINAEPRNINYRLAISHAYIEQGMLNAALPWLESVLTLAPNNKTALTVLPQVKNRLAQLNKAK